MKFYEVVDCRVHKRAHARQSARKIYIHVVQSQHYDCVIGIIPVKMKSVLCRSIAGVNRILGCYC